MIRKVPTPEPGTDAGDEELRERELAQYLAVLRTADGRRRDLDESEYLVIKGARDGGATWKQIAEALGAASPQAAQQRYGALEERGTAAPPGDASRKLSASAPRRPRKSGTRVLRSA